MKWREASVEAPSSWVSSCWMRVRFSRFACGIDGGEGLAVGFVAAEEADAATEAVRGGPVISGEGSARYGCRWSGRGCRSGGLR